MSATALKTKTATTKASRDKRTGCQVWGKAPETERANGIWREGARVKECHNLLQEESGHGAPLLLRFKPGILKCNACDMKYENTMHVRYEI